MKAAFELRRMEVVPGRWVKEFTVKVFLRVPAGVDAARVEGLKTAMGRGVNWFYNQGYRLFSGDQLHVRVEFVGSSAEATVNVDLHRDGELSSQHSFGLGDIDTTLAHEIGHTLGLYDAFSFSALFQHVREDAVHRGRGGRVLGPVRSKQVSGRGLMSDGMYRPDARLVPREAWLLERAVLAGSAVVESGQPASLVRDTTYAMLHGETAPVPSLYERADSDDINAIITLANEGHRASFEQLTQAASGDVGARQALVELAGTGQVHALAALVRIGDVASHPELGDRTAIDALAGLALHAHQVAKSLLRELAAEGHLRALVAAAGLGSAPARTALEDIAANGDVTALVDLAAAGELEAARALAVTGNVEGLRLFAPAVHHALSPLVSRVHAEPLASQARSVAHQSVMREAVRVVA
ncbi:hypothetical protein ABZX92_45910, partial [Lentzea sp. NPDC006480]|uniref:hypothetical protein n=1 Tax=Lentzea sp. NPDC006480 TaxID=3157176 RepID=UPI0033AD68A0